MAIGELINNRYQTLRMLGEGGFGKTYLTEDTHLPSRRKCVVKVLKSVEDNNPQLQQLVRERFYREAAVLEDLGESNSQIPKLYAYFNEVDRYYLVQEFIAGQTLMSEISERGTFDDKRTIELLRDLLPILSFIHSKGIIHRDIKPENIILRDPDRKPVLIDFGAVRETVQTVVSTGGNTRSIVIGTPGFMSMEQNIGRPLFASDIYSLGMTAIYAVTGRLPSQLPNDPATGLILWQNFAPQISAPLKAILDRSIQPDAKDRYMNANVMNEALNEIVPPANFAPQRGTFPQFDNPPPPPPVPATVAVAAGNQNYPPQQNNNYNNNSYNNNPPPAPYNNNPPPTPSNNNSPYQNQLPQSAVRQNLNLPLIIAIVAGTLFVGLIGIVGLLIFIGSQVPDEASQPSSSPSSQTSQPRRSNPSNSAASSPDSSASPDPSESSSPSSSPSAASQSDGLQNFTLKNNTRTAIQEVHISTNQDENWGPNRLTGVPSIPARGTHEFTFTGFTECLFDIQVVFADGDKSEKRKVDLCKIRTFNVNE